MGDGKTTIARAVPAAIVAAMVAMVLFMTIGIQGSVRFALELRAGQLAALVTVGMSIAAATVVFQTVTGNRILTPSLMGLDALYLLIQALFVLTIGTLGVSALPASLKFVIEASLLSALALGLFIPLIRARTDLTVLLLAGVVLGIMFRSLSDLVARLIDPNNFAVVQALSVGDFNTVDPALVMPCAGLTLASVALLWRLRHLLDIVALGPDAAVGLGVHWRRVAPALLALVGVLTATATALVGPVVLLGLLATAFAGVAGRERHAVRLPLAIAISVTLLVAGQLLLSRLLHNALPLSVVIEFFGGIVFIILIIRRRA